MGCPVGGTSVLEVFESWDVGVLGIRPVECRFNSYSDVGKVSFVTTCSDFYCILNPHPYPHQHAPSCDIFVLQIRPVYDIFVLHSVYTSYRTCCSHQNMPDLKQKWQKCLEGRGVSCMLCSLMLFSLCV